MFKKDTPYGLEVCSNLEIFLSLIFALQKIKQFIQAGMQLPEHPYLVVKLREYQLGILNQLQ